MHPVTTPEIVVDAGAIAVLDGHDGVGQVLAMRATHEAITRARAHGIGAVAVRHSNHFGTCMYYTRRVAAADCVAMLTEHKTVDYSMVLKSAKLIVDTRNAIAGSHPHVFKLGAPSSVLVASLPGQHERAVA